MSPYNYDDKINVEDDDEQHETTTVPASIALKSVHRFQSIDFLAGLETPHLPNKTRKLCTENNEANTIDAVAADNNVRPLLPNQANTIDAAAADNNVRPLLLKSQRKPLVIKGPTINPKSGLQRKPYTRKVPYTSKLSLSAPDSTQALKSTSPFYLIQTPSPSSLAGTSVASQVVIKLEKVDSNSCDMHNDFKNLSETQWLSSSHIDHYLQSLVNHHYENENEFGRSVVIWDIASVEGMERSYRPSMIQNNNRDQIFVLVANSNHYVVLSNINLNKSTQFNEFAEYMDDDAPRLNWFMYDTLNDPKHAQFAAGAMDKLFPDMFGYRVNMVKVQQQQGVNDCGLFACAYITLLSNGLDPSQYTFDQVTLRCSFRKFLADDTIQNFGGVQTQCLSEMTEITIDWGYKWEDKFADLIVQFKENRNKKIDNYTVL
jgi:hypothetical protein